MVEYRSGALELSSGAMAKARRYHAWIYEAIRPYLRGRILDIGCGLGNVTEFVAQDHPVVGVDLSQPALAEVRRRTGNRVRAVRADALHPGIGLRGPFDTVLLFNVLEHIGDDSRFLSRIRPLLASSGNLVCQVPAHPALFCRRDLQAGHFRRYTRGTLARALLRAGFHLERLFDFNLVGMIGYLVNKVLLDGGLTDRATLWQIALVDRLVPVLRGIDAFRLPLGLSLFAVARPR